MESKLRSLIKAICWRLIAFITTTIVALILTDEIKLSFQLGLTESIIKLILYYIHERIWICKRKNKM